MISQNSREPDKDDVAVLFYAACHYEDDTRDETDLTIVGVGFGELLSRCERAAEVIAERHRPEGDDWDNVAWFEWLSEYDADSLAAQLFQLDNDHCDMVSTITIKWLQHREL